ncbi:hypothetical protein [Bradyrhizobium sp. AUGA SZCCT0160]|uniref:hypothetical protein n=1 Tax=Bradyrhizobium sp. AUGA SZCCT0160 TaxID=2807662 RepID=UPI001BAE033F|nr:hypothetical protein [Bradyrhizobium sp. AUGA SZCCT0160]MBR1194346.1 hypothetical protein [Bradyrhizobium sp. AUGA SZCCT0160]
MLDLNREIELLERCASECALISDLATDQHAQQENRKLAIEYRQLAEDLKSYRSTWAV